MGLLEDARNIQRKDPAARNVLEVILLYPGFHILVYHRIAHWLYQHKRFFLARWVSQHGRRRTGIEIHPRCHHRQMPVHRSRHGHRVR